jgi:hypothetical protein
MKFYFFLDFDRSMYFKFVFAIIQPTNFFDVYYNIHDLKDDNYKVWQEIILLYLGWMDIDYAIRKDEPPTVTNICTSEDIAPYERWERSNYLNMML